MRAASLCAGIGGADLALEALGFDIAWHAEIDPDASAVLAHHWPDVPNVGDIKAADWKEVNRMAARRNDELAQAMYDRYCQGLSCEEVAAEFGRSRQTVWKMFQRRGWDLRRRPPARPSVEFNGRTYSLGDGGYYRATDGDREYLHRAVWQHHHGQLDADHDVHHLDHDKTNNDLTNLQAMSKAAHTRLHAATEEVMPNEDPAVDVIAAGYP